MKIALNLFLLGALFFTSAPSLAQSEPADRTNDTLGLRPKMRARNYAIYESGKDGTPDMNRAWTMDHRTYVRPRVGPNSSATVRVNGNDEVFRRVLVPGTACTKLALPTNPTEALAQRRAGLGRQYQQCPECEEYLATPNKAVNRCHYGKEFWIREVDLKEFEPEFHVGRNMPTIGLLTLPWVYRFERGHAAPLIDGGFTLSAAFGWKFRVSAKQGMSLFPVIAPGFRALNYTAANNTALEGESSETGGAVTLATGLIFEWERKQIGVVLGTDSPLGDKGRHFIYGGAPWLAFTIGYDLFTQDRNAKGPVKEN